MNKLTSKMLKTIIILCVFINVVSCANKKEQTATQNINNSIDNQATESEQIYSSTQETELRPAVQLDDETMELLKEYLIKEDERKGSGRSIINGLRQLNGTKKTISLFLLRK